MKHLKINKDVEIVVADNEYLELMVLRNFIDQPNTSNIPESSLPLKKDLDISKTVPEEHYYYHDYYGMK